MSEEKIDASIGAHPVIKRIEAVDLFKFLVLFFMIQGHLFRAYLLEPIRLTSWFHIHEILHGIVAPGFLFLSGFSVFLSYYNKKKEYMSLGKAFFVRIRRALFVIWIGYWLHIPYLSLRKSYHEISRGVLIEFLKVDILQCIGVGVLLFTLIAVLVKREKIIVSISVLFSLLFFLLPPVMKDVRIWYVIDPYFSHEMSLFSLFPWAGFLFLGVVGAYFYTQIKKQLYFLILLVIGVVGFPWVFIINDPLGRKSELTLVGNLNKVAGICLLFYIAYWVVGRFRGKVIDIMKKSAKESLFVYVLHLFIIFNFLSIPGLQYIFNNALNVYEALGMFIVVQAIVFACSFFYCYLKEKRHKIWRILFYIFWGGFFIIFILRPY